MFADRMWKRIKVGKGVKLREPEYIFINQNKQQNKN